MNVPLRVAMIIPSYFPALGGAERQLEALIPELTKHGIESTVFTKKLPNTASEEIINGVQVFRLAAMRWNWTFLCSLAQALFLTRGKFDLLHVHTVNSPFFITALLRFIHRSAVIVKIPRTGKGAPFTKLVTSPVKKLFFKSIAKNVDSFIALNSEAVNELRNANISPSRIAYLSNGVDTSFFTPCSSQTKILLQEKFDLKNKIVICTSSRLIARKQVDLLLRAFSETAAEVPSAVLIIIGDGPQRQELEQLTSKLELVDRVRFVGKLVPGEVLDILQVADIYVSASCSEGMSNAVLEAMACGVVPICAKIPGNSELLQDIEPLLLFSSNNASELASVLSSLALDTSKRIELSSKVVSKINTEYNISSVALSYNNLYRDILARNDKKD